MICQAFFEKSSDFLLFDVDFAIIIHVLKRSLYYDIMVKNKLFLLSI